MAILIGAQKLSKAFTSRPLFENVSFSIEANDRIGLIGPNGAGKSTLMSILAGQIQADSGQLTSMKGLRIGYLQQVPLFKENATLESTLHEGVVDPDDWQSLALIHETSSKLELSSLDPATPIASLSGGWKKRVALARELIRQPDVLLLDEPTNHLDVESILWLEDFLSETSFAVMTITHDRAFLQKVANRILELDRRHPGGLLSAKGTYADFLAAREQLLAAQESLQQKLQNTYRRELEWLRRGAQARQTKQKARIEATFGLEDQLKELKDRNRVGVAELEFQSPERSPKKLIEAEGISKAYDGQLIIPTFNLQITPQSRIGLMGANGSGKSTLIRLLTGQELPDTGRVKHADKLKIAYFEQNRESLNPSETAMRAVCPNGDFVDYRGQKVHVRSYLSRFLFGPQQVETEVRKLSGGEQSRLLLARLMLKEANLLVLDEPTNDLDAETLNTLAEVLHEFQGAILIVTHDRYFMDQVSNQIFAFGINESGQKSIDRMVGMEQWQEWVDIQRKIRRELETNREKPKASRSSVSQQRLSYQEQREFDLMETSIEEAERAVESLSAKLEQSAELSSTEIAELSQNLAKAQRRVDELYARWSELGSRVQP